MSKWISVKDRLPTKEDGWIGHSQNSFDKEHKYFIRVLVYETGGYGKRVMIRPFQVLLVGDWTMHNDECEIATGSFMDINTDWYITHWQPLPDQPEEVE